MRVINGYVKRSELRRRVIADKLTCVQRTSAVDIGWIDRE